MPHALIVDDEADVVGWMSEVVKAEGYTVATADSLRNAQINHGVDSFRLQEDDLSIRFT